MKIQPSKLKPVRLKMYTVRNGEYFLSGDFMPGLKMVIVPTKEKRSAGGQEYLCHFVKQSK